MFQILVMLLFGFPAVVVSLLLSVLGILSEKFWLVVAGALLFLPFSYYLNGSPRLSGFAILFPLSHFGAAVAVYRKNRVWAWLLLAPAFLISVYVAGVALFFNAVNVRP